MVTTNFEKDDTDWFGLGYRWRSGIEVSPEDKAKVARLFGRIDTPVAREVRQPRAKRLRLTLEEIGQMVRAYVDAGEQPMKTGAATGAARDRFLRQSEVLKKIGFGVSTLKEMIASGSFPKPVRIGARAVRWSENEIDAWMAARLRERDGDETPFE